MSDRRVFKFLSRIRKSIFKGQNIDELLKTIDLLTGRMYLEKLVIRHYAN